MITKRDRNESRQRRHLRVRKRVRGIADRPRLCVFRSLKHIYAQVVDDARGVTLAAASTLDPEVRDAVGKNGGNVGGAQKVGELIARRAQASGVKQVVFDRGGYKYHGRVAALAEAARQGGLEF